MGDRLRFRENVYVNGIYSVGSKMENQGPIGPLLSAAVDNDMFGEKDVYKRQDGGRVKLAPAVCSQKISAGE